MDQKHFVVTCYVQHETEYPIAVFHTQEEAQKFADKKKKEAPFSRVGDKLFYKIYPV